MNRPPRNMWTTYHELPARLVRPVLPALFDKPVKQATKDLLDPKDQQAQLGLLVQSERPDQLVVKDQSEMSEVSDLQVLKDQQAWQVRLALQVL